MESLPNSFFVNSLPDLSTKEIFNPTLTLLSTVEPRYTEVGYNKILL